MIELGATTGIANSLSQPAVHQPTTAIKKAQQAVQKYEKAQQNRLPQSSSSSQLEPNVPSGPLPIAGVANMSSETGEKAKAPGSAVVGDSPAQNEVPRSAVVGEGPSQNEVPKSAVMGDSPSQNEVPRSAVVGDSPAQNEVSKSAVMGDSPAQAEVPKSAVVGDSPAQNEVPRSAVMERGPAQAEVPRSAVVGDSPSQNEDPSENPLIKEEESAKSEIFFTEEPTDVEESSLDESQKEEQDQLAHRLKQNKAEEANPVDYKADVQIFYKRKCQNNQKNCNRGPIFTNIKSVIFNYNRTQERNLAQAKKKKKANQ